VRIQGAGLLRSSQGRVAGGGRNDNNDNNNNAPPRNNDNNNSNSNNTDHDAPPTTKTTAGFAPFATIWRKIHVFNFIYDSVESALFMRVVDLFGDGGGGGKEDLLFIFLFFCLHNQKKPVHLSRTSK
jgi:hypothetical protein